MDVALTRAAILAAHLGEDGIILTTTQIPVIGSRVVDSKFMELRFLVDCVELLNPLNVRERRLSWEMLSILRRKNKPLTEPLSQPS